jgi:hypothetical protein
MGAGKTLTATYLAWKNWYSRQMKIFSNYHLYKVPYYYIHTVKQLDYMHEGVALLDEMWRKIAKLSAIRGFKNVTQSEQQVRFRYTGKK